MFLAYLKLKTIITSLNFLKLTRIFGLYLVFLSQSIKTLILYFMYPIKNFRFVSVNLYVRVGNILSSDYQREVLFSYLSNQNPILNFSKITRYFSKNLHTLAKFYIIQWLDYFYLLYVTCSLVAIKNNVHNRGGSRA